MVRIGREPWDRIYWRCEDQVHKLIWQSVVPQRHQTAFETWRLQDRVVDQAWRVFSPEVSGNRL
jgi:hypothetical protein